jgi:hypothetical protein
MKTSLSKNDPPDRKTVSPEKDEQQNVEQGISNLEVTVPPVWAFEILRFYCSILDIRLFKQRGHPNFA